MAHLDSVLLRTIIRGMVRQLVVPSFSLRHAGCVPCRHDVDPLCVPQRMVDQGMIRRLEDTAMQFEELTNALGDPAVNMRVLIT